MQGYHCNDCGHDDKYFDSDEKMNIYCLRCSSTEIEIFEDT